MSGEPLCVPGCGHFSGGDVRHHPDCPHYPESLTKIHDDTVQELRTLRLALANAQSALEARDRSRLCAVNENIQQLVDAAMGWIGETQDRASKIESATRFYVAAHALIERNGRFLVCRRSKDNDYMPGKWDIPGGTVEAGETVEDALAREVIEETEVRIKIGKPVFVYSNLGSLPERQHVQIVYAARYVDGLAIPRDEHDSVSWAKPREILKMDKIAFLKAFLDRYPLMKNK